jgi:Small Multidrug Resistance protein
MPVTLTPNLAWMLLVVAGLLEIVWSISMKASHGFTKHHFTAITIIAAWLSFGCSGWRCVNSRWELLMRSGRGLAQSGQPYSALSFLANRSAPRASDASHSSYAASSG